MIVSDADEITVIELEAELVRAPRLMQPDDAQPCKVRGGHHQRSELLSSIQH